jgi:iron complex outermembrane receptor protein
MPHRPTALAAAVSAACLLATTPAPAQALGDSETLPNIVVIGVRDNTLGEEVLNLDERSGRPAADGADLLRSVTGLSLGRFGGRGLEPTLRGQSQGRINVLLDGAYIHGGCPNRMDPPTSFASVNTFERIVVLKGVQTLRYGGGGSGGTLLFERENEPARDGFSGGLRAGSSSNGLRTDLALEMAWSGEPGYLRMNIEDRDADSYEDGDGDTVRSAFEESSLYLAGGLRLRDRDRLELALESTRTDDALLPRCRHGRADGRERAVSPALPGLRPRCLRYAERGAVPQRRRTPHGQLQQPAPRGAGSTARAVALGDDRGPGDR